MMRIMVSITFFNRYYGTGVKLGECGLTIMNASRNDSGTWSCHLGVADVSNVDQMKEISLRITGNLNIYSKFTIRSS